MAVAHRIAGGVWSAWLDAAWHPGDRRLHAELVAALELVDVSGLRRWQDPEDLVEPVAETVGQAMYWQAPHDEDALTADPDVTTALRPIATALVCAPAAAWWSNGLDLTALRCTRWDLSGSAGPPPLTGAANRLRRWRAEMLAGEIEAATNRPADLEAPFSGHWWSTPPAESVTTARPVAGLGSVELAWHEDSLGLADASIWSLETVRAPRVWEIDGPVAWVDLVERYPMEVTHARRHDWYRTTGHVGAWFILDWSAVADEWDAVHVSMPLTSPSPPGRCRWPAAAQRRCWPVGTRIRPGGSPTYSAWAQDLRPPGTTTSRADPTRTGTRYPNSPWLTGHRSMTGHGSACGRIRLPRL